jgi:hypothetical protein
MGMASSQDSRQLSGRAGRNRTKVGNTVHLSRYPQTKKKCRGTEPRIGSGHLRRIPPRTARNSRSERPVLATSNWRDAAQGKLGIVGRQRNRPIPSSHKEDAGMMRSPKSARITKKGTRFFNLVPDILVRLAGIEPTTPWFVAKYSIQLSYSRLSNIVTQSFRFGKLDFFNRCLNILPFKHFPLQQDCAFRS